MPDWRKVARAKARKYGVDPDIFEAQINQESGFDEDVISGRRRSSAGALGIAQFMPDTARSMGVNPLNPEEALDGSARLMAQHLRKYDGDYRKALAAYNAGAGNVDKYGGVPPFRETQNYVKAILQNNQGRSSDVASSSRTSRRATSTSVPGSTLVTPQQRPIFDVLRRLQSRQSGAEGEDTESSLARTVATLKRITEPPPQAPPVSSAVPPPAGAPTAQRKGRVAPGSIYELFYDPLGGWDRGKSIGPIGGHQHVHVAADPRRVKWILEQARKRFGLQVREHPDYDKVDPVHTEGSHHYKREAGDVSGADEDERAFVNWIRKKYGF